MSMDHKYICHGWRMSYSGAPFGGLLLVSHYHVIKRITNTVLW